MCTVPRVGLIAPVRVQPDHGGTLGGLGKEYLRRIMGIQFQGFAGVRHPHLQRQELLDCLREIHLKL